MRRYIDLERMAKNGRATEKRLATDLKIERGESPAAGFETTAPSTSMKLRLG